MQDHEAMDAGGLSSGVSTPKLFGLDFTRLTAVEVAERVAGHRTVKGNRASLIVTANSDHIGRLPRDPDFRRAYDFADLVTADGFPVVLYARLRGLALKGRTAGTDILASLMRDQDLGGARLYFVVDGPDTQVGLEAWSAAKGLSPSHVRIEQAVDGFARNGDYQDALAGRIFAHGTDILILGIGAPRSEIFVQSRAALLPGCTALCVGEAVRIEAGVSHRAPALARTLNLEWLWRLLSRPGHLWKRYTLDMRWFLAAVWTDLRSKRT
jgi:N-acetylglucosaminyldiphosphoundecaprenol N-acetyl-beta-D-mannosaminyltransferase